MVAGFGASTREGRNEQSVYLEAVFQSVSNAGALSFLSVFLVRLGAPNWLVGFYTSLPALVMILAALPMGSFVPRQRSLTSTVNRARLLFRAGVGSLALLPYLPARLAPYLLVGVRGAIAVPDAAIVVAETTLMGRVTTPRRRMSMLGTRSAILGLFSAALGFLAGQWLDWAPYPLNYQLLFCTAFLSGLGSAWALGRIRLPEAPGPVGDRKVSGGLRSLLPLLRSAPAFRNFAIAAFVFRIGMSLPMGLYTIYRVRILGSSDAWIGILYTVERGLSVFSYFALSRLVARRRFRRWLWVGCLLMALYPLTTALAKTPQMLLIPAVILGVFSPAMNLFLRDTLYQVSPEDERPAFVAANQFLSSITQFAVPLLGTLLADMTSVAIALVVGAALRFIGGFAFWLLGVGSQKRADELSRS